MTRDELASLIGEGFEYAAVAPTPDGDIDNNEDKLQILGYYRGFGAGTLFQILGAPVVSALRQAVVSCQRLAKLVPMRKGRVRSDT